jgi:hypothetical protein
MGDTVVILDNDSQTEKIRVARVMFKYHSGWYNTENEWEEGSVVIVTGLPDDRNEIGQDIGVVVRMEDKPPEGEYVYGYILRPAYAPDHEMIPILHRIEAEVLTAARDASYCLAHERPDMGLTELYWNGAECQLDLKTVTVYYTAPYKLTYSILAPQIYRLIGGKSRIVIRPLVFKTH